MKDAVTYTIEDTPVVKKITPVRGTTLGGTKITLEGEYFGNNVDDVEVSIDGALCDV